MNTVYSDKAKENKGRSVANSMPDKLKGKPQAFQELANNSPRVKQLRAYQANADSFSRLQKKNFINTSGDQKNFTLQRKSRADVAQLGKKKVEVIKEKDEEKEFKSALKTNFKASKGDAEAKNPGGGGGGGTPFIIPANGTRHHIYPKSLLSTPAFMVSKGLEAYAGTMAQISPKAQSYGQAEHNSIKALGTSIGLNNDGSVNNMNNYYWNQGIYFFGISTDYRVDDPGNNPEPFKPKNTPSDSFQNPKDFGAAMQNVLSNISSLGVTGATDTNVLKYARTKFNTLSRSGVNYTKDLKGEDWTIAPRPESAESYNKLWGQALKIYTLNKTGTNDYKNYPAGQLNLIESKFTANIKDLFDFENLKHPVIRISKIKAAITGPVAEKFILDALTHFNAAKVAAKPHIIFDEMKHCLSDVTGAFDNLVQPVSAGLTQIFNTTTLAIETARTNINADAKLTEAIAISR